VLGKLPFHESDGISSEIGESSKRTLSLSSTTSANESSHAGTIVGSSHSAKPYNRMNSRPPYSGNGNGYTRQLLIDRRQKIVICV
jgi:hypothetical protein